MKKFLLIILGLSLMFGFACNVSAAPAPTLFVYNDTKKECGTFRDGDEYVSYNLPDGWQTYNYSKSTAKSTQSYCDELGYKNIGNIVRYYDLAPKYSALKRPDYNAKPNHFNYPLFFSLGFVFVLVTTTGLIIFIKKK